jgi:GT2 family glycosyltransferase
VPVMKSADTSSETAMPPASDRNIAPLVSIVILTYNRGLLARQLIASLIKTDYQPLEIILVDNCSEDPVRNYLLEFLPAIQLIEMESNLGVAGRNRGIEASNGEIIITLDDDVSGLTGDHVRKIVDLLADRAVGAVCFKVVDPDNRITNWCHHCDIEKYSEKNFITNEITEGAVAFKSAVVRKSGLYPAQFFISHEGPDLAYRIMNQGYLVVYSPDVQVVHAHAREGRPGWRRYYYDTRNLLWLAVRNYPLLYGIKRVVIGMGAMFIYAARDGYLRYWLRGVWHGIGGLARAYRDRIPPTPNTRMLIEQIERNRPPFWLMVRKRIFKKEVRI